MSCASTTESMWKNTYYKEKIGSFLMSEDGVTLAIIGEKYHYIISLDTELKNILISTKRIFLKPSFYSFKVDKDNNVSGNYTLYYSNKNKNDEKWLNNNGFKKQTSHSDKKYTYTFSGSVNGKRYSINKDINKNFSFNESYFLNIEESSSSYGNIGKMLATPITVSVDGVKAVSGIVLLTAFAGTMMVIGGEFK